MIQLWKLRSAAREFRYKLRYPFSTHLPTWNDGDHDHVCIARRLLDEESFVAVCPRHGKCDIASDDACDVCGYMRILEFNVNDDGKKYIDLI